MSKDALTKMHTRLVSPMGSVESGPQWGKGVEQHRRENRNVDFIRLAVSVEMIQLVDGVTMVRVRVWVNVYPVGIVGPTRRLNVPFRDGTLLTVRVVSVMDIVRAQTIKLACSPATI